MRMLVFVLTVVPLVAAGCATPAAPPELEAAGADATGSAGEPRTIEWTRWFRAGTPVVSSRDPAAPPIVPVEPGAERVTVTVAWTPTAPTATTMQLYVDFDGTQAASVEGTSPIVVVFEPADLLGEKLETSVYPGKASLVVDQDVHVTILVEPVPR